MRRIKRYKNRKLYDLDLATYVRMDDLITSVQEGEEIKVVDAREPKRPFLDCVDITVATLLTAIAGSDSGSITMDDLKPIIAKLPKIAAAA